MGLREFCLALDFDPSRWSKIERGMLPPPVDPRTLEEIARLLGLPFNSKESERLFDLAKLSRGEIPVDLINNAKLLEKLPLMFRTLRGEKPTKEELETIADLIRHS